MTSITTFIRFSNPSICPKLAVAYATLQQSADWIDHNKQYAPLLAQLQSMWNSTSLPG